MTCPKSKDGKHEFEEFAVWCDGQHGIRCVHCSENEYEDGSGDDSPLFTIADIEAQARKEATLKLLDELEKRLNEIFWQYGSALCECLYCCEMGEKENCQVQPLMNWIAAKRKKIGGTD